MNKVLKLYIYGILFRIEIGKKILKYGNIYLGVDLDLIYFVY